MINDVIDLKFSMNLLFYLLLCEYNLLIHSMYYNYFSNVDASCNFAFCSLSYFNVLEEKAL